MGRYLVKGSIHVHESYRSCLASEGGSTLVSLGILAISDCPNASYRDKPLGFRVLGYRILGFQELGFLFGALYGLELPHVRKARSREVVYPESPM